MWHILFMQVQDFALACEHGGSTDMQGLDTGLQLLTAAFVPEVAVFVKPVYYSQSSQCAACWGSTKMFGQMLKWTVSAVCSGPVAESV